MPGDWGCVPVDSEEEIREYRKGKGSKYEWDTAPELQVSSVSH